MKKLISILYCSVLMLPAYAMTDEHGGIHIHMRNGEQIDDNNCSSPKYCIEMRPWYYHLWYSDYENIEDQADRLQDETAWPSQRENYSDYLLR